MSTSGQYSWNTTTSEIINRSLRILGVVQSGQSATTNQYNDAKYALNALVKRIAADGVRLWTLNELIYSIPTPSTVVGTDGSYYYAAINHTSTANDVPVSGANYTDNWYIGADTTTNTHQVSVNYVSANTLTLSGGYQGIDSAFYRENNNDYSLQIISLQDYYRFEDKYVRSTIPTHIAIDQTLNRTNMYLYPYPYTASGRVHVLGVKILQDFTNTSDNPDFPVEWVEALTYMLAAILSDEYSKALDERGYLMNKADGLYKKALGNDRTLQDTMVVKGSYSVRNRR